LCNASSRKRRRSAGNFNAKEDQRTKKLVAFIPYFANLIGRGYVVRATSVETGNNEKVTIAFSRVALCCRNHNRLGSPFQRHFDQGATLESVFMITYRDYQTAAIDAAINANNGVCVLPTGSGKSVICAGIVDSSDGGV
jgi:hypothetical protein